MTTPIDEVLQLVQEHVPDASVHGQAEESSSPTSPGAPAPKTYRITICFPAGTPMPEMMNSCENNRRATAAGL